MPHHHRASSLRQSNKPFKSKHSSKSSLKDAAKGRSADDLVAARRLSSHKSSPLSASGNAIGSRQHRKNAAKQAQLAKRAALVQSNRIFDQSPTSGAGLAKGSGGAPRICAVVYLAEDGDSWDAVRQLESEGDDGGVKPLPGRSVDQARAANLPLAELEATRFRQTIQFLPMPYGALYPTLDACKCADFVLLVLSASTSIEPGSWGELCLRTLQAQGLPTVLVAVPTLHPDGATGSGGSTKAGPALKAANEARKSLLSFARYFSPDVDKVHALDDHAERAALLRTLATATPKRVAWRDFRAWTVAESTEWTPSSPDGQRGTLKVEGWVRGAPLSANRLVHIPDFGDFAIDRITYAPPAGRRVPRAAAPAGGDAEMETEEERPLQPGDVLQQRDAEVADDLVSENEPDDLANEQTWPTEEEMAAADKYAPDADVPPPAMPGTTPRAITKTSRNAADDPKFRAAWIIESDDDDDDDDDDNDADMDDDDAEAMSGDEEVEAAVDDYAALKAQALAQAGAGAGGTQDDDAASAGSFEDMSDDAAAAEIEAYRARRRDEAEDAQFPDEVDTPLDVSARVRFARYRGLKSFRTSPWDPYEDLPRDYARIYQFDDFHKTRRRVEASALVDGVDPGTRVWVYVSDVPASVQARTGEGKMDLPFVLFGLLRHEHKKSVLNFTLTRNTEYVAPVRSKDELVLCLGPRRIKVNPIWSQHTRGGGKGVNNVHKFERFLRHGGPSVGTVYAPITFGGSTAPAVLLRQRSEEGYDQRGVGAAQMPHLVGSGSLLDAGPTRINAKRIVLSGHPFKVHKKTATIRFMFFNPEDVHYYAPVALHTKLGRTGHIRESLGTHGYFKAHFDGPISQMDTILMNLYKRVYPKWASVWTESQRELPLSIQQQQKDKTAEEDMMQ